MLVVFAFGVVLLHRPALQALAYVLIHDGGNYQADFAILFGGEECHVKAAELIQSANVEQVLVFATRPSRLELARITPSSLAQSVHMLETLNVDDSKVRTVRIVPADNENRLNVIVNFMRARKDKTALLVCDELNSHLGHLFLSRVATSDVVAQITVIPVRNRHVHPMNWWKSTGGIRYYFDSFFKLSAAYLFPNPKREWKTRTWDEFHDAAVDSK